MKHLINYLHSSLKKKICPLTKKNSLELYPAVLWTFISVIRAEVYPRSKGRLHFRFTFPLPRFFELDDLCHLRPSRWIYFSVPFLLRPLHLTRPSQHCPPSRALSYSFTWSLHFSFPAGGLTNVAVKQKVRREFIAVTRLSLPPFEQPTSPR